MSNSASSACGLNGSTFAFATETEAAGTASKSASSASGAKGSFGWGRSASLGAIPAELTRCAGALAGASPNKASRASGAKGSTEVTVITLSLTVAGKGA